MLFIGLTGNYGMGKSYVLSVFRELGADVLDADEIVAELLEKKTVIQRIKRLLGDSVLKSDGKLDRKAVAEVVFNDRDLRDKLEELIHPMVFRKIKFFMRKSKKNAGITIIEVPLLFESRYQMKFDRIITVFTDQKTAIERLKKVGISRKQALMRLHAQMPVSEKKRLSDYTIDNSRSRFETRRQVERIYYQLLNESK